MKKALFFLFMLMMLDPRFATAQVMNPANGHYYELIYAGGNIPWSTAKAAAEARTFMGVNGHLATITAADENSLLVANFGPYLLNAWLGGYQDTSVSDYSEPGGGWRWVTGETWNYTNWNLGEPSNGNVIGFDYENRLSFSDTSGHWNDVPDSAPYGTGYYVVEYEPANAFNVCLLYDSTKAVKSGATIPIKVQLCDANGNNVSASNTEVHAISVIQTSTNAPGSLEDSGNANPDFDFRYDASLGGTGGYIFNLSTKGYPKGTYNLNFTAGNDPTIHSAQFQVK